MKEIGEKLTNNYYRRKTDRMCICEKIRHWWRDDVVLFRALLLNVFVIAIIGGAAGALIILGVLYIYGR